MMFSAYKLNNRVTIPTLMYSFSYLEPVCSMSSSNCCFLTCIQEAGQVVWYSHLFKNFPKFVVIHIVKGFGIVSKAEVGVFLELACFSDDPAFHINLNVHHSSSIPTVLQHRFNQPHMVSIVIFTMEKSPPVNEPLLFMASNQPMCMFYICYMCVVCDLMVKNPPANAANKREANLIHSLGTSPGGGHGNPHQYSCLENPTERITWCARVHRVSKSRTC